MDRRIVALHKTAAKQEGVIGLAGGLPANELLPREELALALAEVAAFDRDALQYGWAEGDESLRTWIAKRLSARGASIDPTRIIITAGAQQALALVGCWLHGARIAVGDATYPAAIDAFKDGGALVVPDHGTARYVTVGVSNPHGVDLISRAELLESGEILIADEAYAELRFDGRTPRPLVGIAADRVWHVGTVSKTVCPGLRIGWLISPVAAHAAIVELKRSADLQTASISQAALVKFLERVDYDELVARARRFYAERCARLSTALRRHVRGMAFAEPEGGFSIWLETGERGDDVALLEAAITEGVAFDPGSAFRCVPGDQIALRLSFSNVPAAELDEAARRLDRAFVRWHQAQSA